MKRSFTLILSLVLVVAMALTGCQPNETKKEEAVATLESNVVTMDEYTFFYRVFQTNLEGQAMYFGYGEDNLLEFWNTAQGDIAMKDMLAQEAMASVKEHVLLYNAAVANGTKADPDVLAASDEEVDALLEQVGSEEEFFNNYRVTPDLMKEMYHRLDLVDQFLMELVEEVEVTDEELQKAYEENKDQYDKVTVRHILITANDDMTEEEVEAAKEKAEDLLSQLQDGANIGELAAEHSEDPGSKDNNGEYTFGRGEMVEPFETWSFAAQPGDQGIVETSYGYHVMEMIGHSDFEAVKESVRDALRYEKVNELRDEIIAPAYSDEWEHNEDLVSMLNVEAELLGADPAAAPANGDSGEQDGEETPSEEDEQEEE